jgi:hypothetical protein
VSSELVKHQAGPLAPLALTLSQQEVAEFQEAWDVNIGSGGVSVGDLSRIKIASGGLAQFVVPTLEGDKGISKLEGVVVLAKDTRAYWKSEEVNNNPPDCSSNDGVTGTGDPGGACGSCPLAKFGTHGDGRACKQIKQLFMMRGESMLPELVSLPPTSVVPANRFFVKLQASRIPHYAALISIDVEATKNPQGKPYGKARFNHVRTLTPEEKERALEFRKMCQELATRVTAPQTKQEVGGGA